MMREFDALKGYPEPPTPRVVGQNIRTIQNRIVASYRGKEFYDGNRNNGYGGLKYDGRWRPIAQFMAMEYGLNKDSSILQIGCDKGFLLHDFQEYLPGIKVRGVEISDYAIETAMESIKPHVRKAALTELPFESGEFDFVIALGAVYTLNLGDAIHCLKEIQRVGRGQSFITLASYRTEEEKKLFEAWTLLGTTILQECDWLEVLEHVGYTGDYKFTGAKTLSLVSAHESK